MAMATRLTRPTQSLPKLAKQAKQQAPRTRAARKLLVRARGLLSGRRMLEGRRKSQSTSPARPATRQRRLVTVQALLRAMVPHPLIPSPPLPPNSHTNFERRCRLLLAASGSIPLERRICDSGKEGKGGRGASLDDSSLLDDVSCAPESQVPYLSGSECTS